MVTYTVRIMTSTHMQGRLKRFSFNINLCMRQLHAFMGNRSTNNLASMYTYMQSLALLHVYIYKYSVVNCIVLVHKDLGQFNACLQASIHTRFGADMQNIHTTSKLKISNQ